MYSLQKPPSIGCVQRSAFGAHGALSAIRCKTGSTLIEVMLAIAILIIALVGTSSTYVSGRGQISNQKHYQAAAYLASQKLEEIKAFNYLDINEGEEDETLSLYGISYQRHTEIVLTAAPTPALPKPCKKITVTIQWTGKATDEHTAKLVTYVGP
jgi:type II secretory pathway pseudopilin PulG